MEGEEDLPVPLRSPECPDGLPNLEGQDLARVTAANILYAFCAEVYDLCCMLGKPCAIENPRSSLFWAVTVMCERNSVHMDMIQDHQACAYGSTRPKWTRLLANFPEIHTVCLTCPGNHFHEEWGVTRKGTKRVFATALEVHYPPALCEAICHAFSLFLSKKGCVPASMPSANPMAQAFSGIPPKASKLPSLIPEFVSRFAVLFDSQNNPVWPLPAPALVSFKLLHSVQLGVVEDVVELSNAATEAAASWGLVCDVQVDSSVFRNDILPVGKSCMLCIFGVCREPDEFMDFAAKLSHPLAHECFMPHVLQEAIDANVNWTPSELATLRLKFIAKWTNRAIQLEESERSLKSSMDPVVAAAVRGKRILLFREMLEATGFPDLDVTLELQQGAELTGTIPPTGMLPSKCVPATCTEAMLADLASQLRQSSLADVSGSGDSEVDAKVWEKTLDEVNKGWLSGPLQAEQVPVSAPLSRRFGLAQKMGKIRLIDDYSESLVNSCVNVCESPTLHTTDVVCALLTLWFRQCKGAARSSELCIRTYDLTSAYRQIGLCEHGRKFAFLKVFDPESGTAKLFQSKVLPFGAVRSVHTFLRLARALWWLGVVGCQLMWTSFFDDYISVCEPSLSVNTEQTIIALFKLTGWVFAEEGDKCHPYSQQCEALGVVFNMGPSSLGRAFVSNTDKRIEELCSEIAGVLSSGTLGRKQAQRLRGRMQFADAQLFGRTGKRCLKVLSDFAEGHRFRLLPKDRLFLNLFRELLTLNKPREVNAFDLDNVLIFTDACYDSGSDSWPCGIGGVLLLPSGERFMFSVEIDSRVRKLLGEGSKKQIIFEAETLAAVCAAILWQEHLVDKRCLLFVDNEGTKFSLLKGTADNPVVDALAERFVHLEMTLHSYLWLARVPSKSNIADEVSRGVRERLIALGYADCSVAANATLEELVTSVFKVGEKG